MTLAWTAPADNGGSAITKYQYRHEAGTTVTDTVTWNDVLDGSDSDDDAGNETVVVVGSLTNSTEYAFEVRAVNVVGGGAKAGPETATPASSDTTAPTVAITGVPATSSAAFTATFTFSESVADFVATDITVVNGTVSNFAVDATTTTANTVFTALITPTNSGAVHVDVNANIATDAAGNGNTAAARATSTYTAEEVLVSNIGQSSTVRLAINNSTFDRSQGFTTDGAATLTSVDVSLAVLGSNPPTTDLPAMTLHRGSAHSAVVATLTAPSATADSTPASFRYTAPANTTLKASTTYHLVLEGGAAAVSVTASDNEDSSSRTDWEIADDSGDRDGGSTGSFNVSTGGSLLISVNGNPIPNAAATGAPAITGLAQVGQELTAGAGDIGDTNGLTGADYAWQWQRVEADGTNPVDIGTDSSTYTLVAADADKHIRVVATFTDDLGYSETRTSGQTGEVVSPLISNLGQTYSTPSIGGIIMWGVSFTAGSHPAGYTLDSAEIVSGGGGAVTVSVCEANDSGLPTENCTALDAPTGGIEAGVVSFTHKTGMRLRANTDYALVITSNLDPWSIGITSSNDEDQPGVAGWSIADTGFLGSSIQNARPSARGDKPVIRIQGEARTAPANVDAAGKPEITGAPQALQTLTATAGDLVDKNGLPYDGFPDGYSFLWVRSDADGSNPTTIADATTHEYIPEAADVGKTVKVAVSFTDDDGYSEGPFVSDATVPVYPAADRIAHCDGGGRNCLILTIGEASAAGAGGKKPRGFCMDDSPFQNNPSVCGYGALPRAAFIIGELGHVDTIRRVIESVRWGNAATDSVHLTLGNNFDFPETGGLTMALGLEDLAEFKVWEAARGTGGGNSTVANNYRWSGVPQALVDYPVGLQIILRLLHEENTAATGAPTIAGDGRPGRMLTANLGDIDDADGLPDGGFPAGYTFQWVRVDNGAEADIDMATGRTYTLSGDDAGRAVKVEVGFRDGLGYTETRASGTVSVASALVSNVEQSDDGSATLGTVNDRSQGFTTAGAAVLTGVDVRLVGDSDSTDLPAMTLHRGSADSAAIATLTAPPSATVTTTAANFRYTAPASTTLKASTTYYLVLEGGGVKVGITNSDNEDSGGRTGWEMANDSGRRASSSTGSFSSVATALMISVNGAPVANIAATGEPEIAGQARLDRTLTADIGTMDDANGLPDGFPADYTFQWVRFDDDGMTNPTVIAGATSRTYALENVDAGKTIKVEVSFTDDLGYSETRSSSATEVVEAANDDPTVENEIPDQTATEGEAFSFAFDAGAFFDADGDTLIYTATLSDGSDLPDWLTFTPATRAFTGTPADRDVGTHRVKVTARDDRTGPDGMVSDEFEIAVSASCAAPEFGNRRHFWTGELTVGARYHLDSIQRGFMGTLPLATSTTPILKSAPTPTPWRACNCSGTEH